MNRLLLLALGGGLLIGAVGLVIATAEQNQGPAFIGTGQPVTEDQVRQKLESEGWSGVRIRREGRYFEAMGTKNGEANRIAIDSQTGHLRTEEDDDED
jgi:hypothetical protein